MPAKETVAVELSRESAEAAWTALAVFGGEHATPFVGDARTALRAALDASHPEEKAMALRLRNVIQPPKSKVGSVSPVSDSLLEEAATFIENSRSALSPDQCKRLGEIASEFERRTGQRADFLRDLAERGESS